MRSELSRRSKKSYTTLLMGYGVDMPLREMGPVRPGTPETLMRRRGPGLYDSFRVSWQIGSLVGERVMRYHVRFRPDRACRFQSMSSYLTSECVLPLEYRCTTYGHTKMYPSYQAFLKHLRPRGLVARYCSHALHHICLRTPCNEAFRR